MIKTGPYGGGIRWHCTNCDTNVEIPNHRIRGISWTNGKPPLVCSRCEPHQEYHVQLDLQILLPEENAAKVRETIAKAKLDLAYAARLILNGKDAKLNKWTASVFKGGPHAR